MKSSSRFIVALSVLFILLFVIEYNTEEPIDWTPGFGKTEKKPYGSYLLFELLPELFKDQKIETIRYSITEQLNEELFSKDLKVNYIFIGQEISWNEYETVSLLNFVNNGNNVFIASTRFSDTLLNSLGLKQEYLNNSKYYSYKDSLFQFNFCTNLQSIDSGYTIRNDYDQVNSYFDSIQDYKKSLATDGLHRCVLTEVAWGDGKIILCSMPFIFTNYYMLKPATLDFVVKTLTRFPAQKVWWDEHYKNKENEDTAFRFILRKKGLRWAYYLGLSGLVLFVVFMGKRRQRVIPMLDPMRNASLEFAETVGQVYFEKGDHLDIAHKKIKYFAEYIRTNYFINVTYEIKRSREEFLKHLSEKSGKSEGEIKMLYSYITYLENAASITEKELIYLNTLIETFKATTQPK